MRRTAAEKRSTSKTTIIVAPTTVATCGEAGSADQLILLSGSGDVYGLGPSPKLIVASEGERLAGEVREMAEEAAGNQNKVLILPGDAHAQAIFETDQEDNIMQTILERLQQYR